MTIRYLTTAQLAETLGISRAALEKALSRDDDPPAPAAIIGDIRGWTIEQATVEILPWLASRPGRGSGGGRPRVSRTSPER